MREWVAALRRGESGVSIWDAYERWLKGQGDNVAAKTKRPVRSKRKDTTHVRILKDVIASQKAQINDIHRLRQDEAAKNVKLSNDIAALRDELFTAHHPPSIMRGGRIVPISVLDDSGLLHHLHDTEREALDSVERIGDHGETIHARRGLISPVYQHLVREAHARGLVLRWFPEDCHGVSVTDEKARQGDPGAKRV